MDEEPVASPCVGVCVLDESDVCVGCYRNADEIMQWPGASNDKKREMLRQVATRESEALSQ